MHRAHTDKGHTWKWWLRSRCLTFNLFSLKYPMKFVYLVTELKNILSQQNALSRF